MSEQEFSSLLKLISAEVETAFIAFHSAEELDRLAVNDAEIWIVVQEDALFWRVYRAALQSTAIMTLSRLFDPAGDATTFKSLLNATIGNLHLFSHDALGTRKLVKGEKPEWWENYMAAAWIPKHSADLKFLRKDFLPLAEHFDAIYRPIRDKIYAHRLITDEQASVDLFPMTNRKILTDTVNALYEITRVIEKLYLNGTKPVLGQYDLASEVKHIRSTVESPLRKFVALAKHDSETIKADSAK